MPRFHFFEHGALRKNCVICFQEADIARNYDFSERVPLSFAEDGFFTIRPVGEYPLEPLANPIGFWFGHDLLATIACGLQSTVSLAAPFFLLVRSRFQRG